MSSADRQVLALIPARGGSRALPGKNIRPLDGKPLIHYAIDVARAVPTISRVVTSTDSSEIGAVAREHGSEVLMRPAELARDDTPMLPVVLHALEALEGNTDDRFDAIVLLQPTSPLRTAEDIDASVELLFSSDADAVMSVYPLQKKFHPARLKLIVNGYVQPYLAGARAVGKPRQRLSDLYKGNGAIYVVRRSTIVEKQSLFGDRVLPYLMPLERSLDIDEEIDFLLAEALLAASKGQAGNTDPAE